MKRFTHKLLCEALESRVTPSRARLVDVGHLTTSLADLYATGDSGGLQVDGLDRVLVRVTSADLAATLPPLRAIGFEATGERPDLFFAEGWLPVDELLHAESLGDSGNLRGVIGIHAPLVNIGAVTSQAADVMQTVRVNNAPGGFTGAGVKVGVISDSFNLVASPTVDGKVGYAADKHTGDLPATTFYLQESTSSNQIDEGRAMMQLVHDLAPGAALGFATGNGGEAAFATQIGKLVAAGANVIVDDLTYLSEPFYQDGPIAKAYTAARNAGVVNFSSAANAGSNAYETTSFVSIADGFIPGGVFHAFAAGDARNNLTVPAKSKVTVTLHWDSPFYVPGGVTNDLELFALNAGTNTVYAASANNSIGNDMPYEIVTLDNTASSTALPLELLVQAKSGTGIPGRFIVRASTANFPLQYAGSGTIQGHNGSASVISVAAAPFFNQRSPESFTSTGPVTHIFAPDKSKYASPLVLNKPDLTATDATITTFFGSGNYFFGTSAAAPHAAAVAALLLQQNPGMSPAQVEAALIAASEDLGTAGWDKTTGAGLLNAASAVLGPVVPAALPFFTSFESGSLTTAWDVKSNINGRVRATSDSGGFDGAKSLLLDAFFDGNASLNQATLHIDAQAADVQLTFLAKSFNEGSDDADGVFFSVDGATYFQLVTGNSITGNWSAFNFNLSDEASKRGLTLSTDTRVRFQQVDNGSFSDPGNPDGLAFDAVQIQSNAPLADKIWTGFGSNELWSNPANWSGLTVPDATDRVSITGSDTIIVDSATAKSVYSFSPLFVTGDIVLNDPSHTYAAVTVANGGRIDTSDSFTIHNNLAWTGGGFRGLGSILIPSGQTLTVSGDDPKFIESATLDNSGTIVWTGTGSIHAGSIAGETQGGLVNRSGGTFRVETDADWFQHNFFYQPALTITHLPGATFIRQNVTGDTVLAAAIDFREAINLTGGSLTATGGGTLGGFALAGGNLNLEAGTYTPFGTTQSITGSGAVRLTGGTLAVPTGKAVTIQNLDIVSGFLEGLGTVTVTGNSHWTGGTMRELGLTSFAAGSSLFIEGVDPHFLESRRVESSGGTTWSSGIIHTGSILGDPTGGSWMAKSGSQMNILGDVDWFQHNFFYEPATPFTLQAGAQLNRSTNTESVEFQGKFNSSGAITVSAGDLSLTGGGTWGTSTVNTGNVRWTEDTFTLSNAASITGSGKIIIDGGTATNAKGQTAKFTNLNLSAGGVIAGEGTITVTGSSRWAGGTMTGLGTTAFDPGSGLVIEGVDPKFIESRTIDHSGSTTWTGGLIHTGALLGDATGGHWINRSGAQFIMTGDTDWLQHNFFYQPATPFTLEAGARFDRIAGNGAVEFSGAFNSAGKISVATGTLSLLGGGTWGSTNLNSGTVRLTAGTFTLANGAVLTGDGTLTLDGGFTANATGHTATIDRLAIEAGGTLGGAGTVVVQKSLAWTAGTMKGPGPTEFAAGSTVTISGPAVKFIEGRDITNRGTVTWTGGDIATGQLLGNAFAPAWFNMAGSTFDIRTDADLYQHGFFFGPTMVVSAQPGSVVKKSTGPGITTLAGGLINNGGTVQALAGTLAPGGKYIQTSGATLVTGVLDSELETQVFGGTLDGTGTILADVDHFGGTVRPGMSPGTLSIVGDYDSDGTLAIELHGTAVGSFDKLGIVGTVNLSGPLTVSLGYAPQVGHNFRILDNDDTDAIVGTFQGLAQNAMITVGGTKLQVSYTGGTGNDVTLTVISVAEPPDVELLVNDGGASRSLVTSLKATFSDAVTFPNGIAAAFGLTRDGSPGSVDLGFSQVGNTVTITFADAVFAPAPTNSLIDGRYTLTLVPANIVGAGGPLTGPNTLEFHRFYGDVNGDGTIDGSTDFAAFGNSFGSSSTSAAYNPAYDFDNNGTIDGTVDFAQFGNRFGRTI